MRHYGTIDGNFHFSEAKNLIPAIPDLRILPLTSVLPHEEHDDQRAGPLVSRIADSGIWLNPPVVTPIGETEQLFALLDGANRYHALQTLKYPYILVQVVDYHPPQVTLETWNHVLSDVTPDDILPGIYDLDGVHIEHGDPLTAQAAIARREAIAYVRVLPDWVLMLVADSTDIRRRNDSLRALVNTYKTRARLNRVNFDDLRSVQQLHPEASMLVVFPHYEPAEIIVAARDHVHLPPGVSRHVIQGRAMRLNYPLRALYELEESLEAKNEALIQWIQERVAAKNVRYYEESMYIFDD